MRSKESKFEPTVLHKVINHGNYVECWTDKNGNGGWLIFKELLVELIKADVVILKG